MKMRKIFWLLFIFNINFIIFSEDKVKVAVDTGNPPFMYEDGGKASGIYPFLLSKIFDELGVKYEINAYPWKRALILCENGETGIAGIYKNSEREKIYDYSEPIFPEKIVIYTRTDTNFEFNKIEDLYGKRVGVLVSWSYNENFDKAVSEGKIVKDEAKTDVMNFKKLESKRIDCLLTLEPTGNIIMHQNKFPTIKELNMPFAINDTYLVFNKNTEMKDFLKRFNKVLKKMKKDGRYDKIINDFIKK